MILLTSLHSEVPINGHNRLNGLYRHNRRLPIMPILPTPQDKLRPTRGREQRAKKKEYRCTPTFSLTLNLIL